MKIFFGILIFILLALTFAEKDDCKRKHLSWCFITTIIATALVSILEIIF